MLKKVIVDAVNAQINAEFYSAYLYLAMSAWAERNFYPGFAHWLRLQAEEEKAHALKLYDFLADAGAPADLARIDAPPTAWDNPRHCFNDVYKHEQMVTGKIMDLYELAVNEKSYAVQVQLQWFVNEQVEEEKNASLIAAQLEMVGDDRAAIMVMDAELGGRPQPAGEAEAAS